MTDWRSRLAIVSDEAAESFPEAVDVCLPLGIRAYEVRNLPGGRFPFVDDAIIDEMMATVKQHALLLTGVSPGFFKLAVDAPNAEDEFTTGFPQAFRLMDRMNVQQLAVFSYQRQGGRDAAIPQQALDQLGRAADLCQSEGVEMIIENSASSWGDTGENLAMIAKAINVGVTWDPANAAASGEVAYPAGYAHVRQIIRQVHCKNWVATEAVKGQNVALDEGVVDWPAQLALLEEDGYEGYYTVEPHQWHNRAAASRLNAKQLLAMLGDL